MTLPSIHLQLPTPHCEVRSVQEARCIALQQEVDRLRGELVRSHKKNNELMASFYFKCVISASVLVVLLALLWL